ncbi:GNAT family N-acetyltransferase [soil metagenome]
MRADLESLYAFQCEPVGQAMAAVKARSRAAFWGRWEENLADTRIAARGIWVSGVLAGHVSGFPLEGADYLGYWLGEAHWGRGIATRAVHLFLLAVTTRPLRARVAAHNLASLRVLERNGFVVTGSRHSPEDERYLACAEMMLELAE